MRFQYSLGSSLFLLSLLISVINAAAGPFQVVGTVDCVDCEKNHFKTSEAFSGVGVTIDCMVMSNGKEVTRRVGASKLDEQGKFTISLPKDIIVQDGHKLSLKRECYAKLDSKSCVVAHKSSDDHVTKIVIVSGTMIGLNNKLTLSSSLSLCSNLAFMPPFFKGFTPKYPPVPKQRRPKPKVDKCELCKNNFPLETCQKYKICN